MAVELGSGQGVEAAFLARSGFHVHTYDSDPSVATVMAELGRDLPVQHHMTPLEDLADLPPCDLILSCVALPFLSRPAFDTLWNIMVKRLAPGGVLAVDLFGDRDQWANDEGTFLTREEVDHFLVGFTSTVTEREEDGHSFSGPKHWHTYEVIGTAART